MKRRRKKAAPPPPPREPGPAAPVRFDIQSRRLTVLLLGVSVAMHSLIFPPITVWPLAYVCLVPWVLVVGGFARPRWVYVSSYLFGLAFFLINLTWICTTTAPGYVALSAYLAVYYPLMACPIRHAVRRRRCPLVVALPVIWVGAEFLRAIVITGFPWFFLAHSQYQVLSMIQVSDLTGAYGVSFVVAMVNGALADMLFAMFRARRASAQTRPRRFAWPSLAAAGTCVALVLIYGQVQLRRDTSSAGPRIAVVQGDYPLRVTSRGPRADDKAERYFELLTLAAREKPDVFLLPETPWEMYLNREFRELDPSTHWQVGWSRYCFQRLQAFAQQHNAHVITGAMSKKLTRLNMRAEQWNWNSAFVIKPDRSEPDRYDKVHLVYFGETVPFRFGRFRFLYIWFNSLSPFGFDDYEYSLTPGESFKVFEMSNPSRLDRTYRFGVPICYEDVMPYVSRRFVIGPDGKKRVDFLLNISNDGWFLHSNELPQHLAICSFRAVENRVGIARAVNTGISGFIEPTGRVHHLVTDATGRYHGPGIDGFQVATIRVDSRRSLYSRIGDVFALACLVLWIAAYIDYIVVRSLTKRNPARMESSP